MLSVYIFYSSPNWSKSPVINIPLFPILFKSPFFFDKRQAVIFIMEQSQ